MKRLSIPAAAVSFAVSAYFACVALVNSSALYAICGALWLATGSIWLAIMYRNAVEHERFMRNHRARMAALAARADAADWLYRADDDVREARKRGLR